MLELAEKPVKDWFFTVIADYNISHAFQKILNLHHAIQSSSAPGQPHDSAVAESFFASMKKEALYRNEKYWIIEEAIHFQIIWFSASKQNSTRMGAVLFLAKPSRSDTIARIAGGGCKFVKVGAGKILWLQDKARRCFDTLLLRCWTNDLQTILWAYDH